MQDNYSVRIGYSENSHKKLIEEFIIDLPSEISVEKYFHEQFHNFDGKIDDYIPFVIGLSEWLVNQSSVFAFNIVLDKVRKLIKGYVNNSPLKNASFEIVIGLGENCKIFKAENVSEESAMKAYDDFQNKYLKHRK